MASAEGIAQLRDHDSIELFESKSHWRRAFEYLIRDYLTLGALAIVIFLTLVSIAAPFISSQILGIDGFDVQDLSNNFRPPSADHILGTDEQGRDHLVRLMFAGQVSLGIAFIAGILSITIGIVLGLVAGYYGGLADDVLNWLITTIASIPGLFLLLIISSVLSPGPLGLILVLGLLGWIGTMRLVRGETLSLREREFVVATRALGASNTRIMFQHILPNLVSIVVVSLAIDIGVLILVESSLSFLGFGIQPPIPSWGNMLTGAQSYFRKAPHLVWAPGILITTTVLCLYLIGDGIRDALDPTVNSQ